MATAQRELGRESIERLAGRLRGEVIAPGDPATTRRGWSGTRRSTGTRRSWRGAQGCPTSSKRCGSPGRPSSRSPCAAAATTSPGSGRATAAIVVDLSPMQAVHVDPQARIATAEGGTLGATFDRETQAFGLATTLGIVSSTGISRPDARRRHRLAPAKARPHRRQPRRGRGRHGRGRAGACIRRREPRPLLGPARWRRQLRGRHVVQLPAASRRPGPPLRPARVAGGGCCRRPASCPRLHGGGARRGDDDLDPAHRAAGPVPARIGPRQPDRSDRVLLRRPSGGGRSRTGAAAGARRARRRRARGAAYTAFQSMFDAPGRPASTTTGRPST